MRFATILLLASLFVSCDRSRGSPTHPTSSTNRDRPNYQGQWTGSYRVDRCTPFPSETYASFCTGFAPGTTIPVSMTFSQNRDVVTGQFIAGGLISSGFVSALDTQGGVEIRATNSTFPYAYDFTWRLSIPEPRRLVGTVSLVRSGNAGLFGGANIEGTVVSLVR